MYLCPVIKKTTQVNMLVLYKFLMLGWLVAKLCIVGGRFKSRTVQLAQETEALLRHQSFCSLWLLHPSAEDNSRCLADI